MINSTGVFILSDSGEYEPIQRSDDASYVVVEVTGIYPHPSVKMVVALPNVCAASPSFMEAFIYEFKLAMIDLHEHTISKLETSLSRG